MGDNSSVLQNLRERASRHRKVAKQYTIGVFCTIFSAIGVYVYFSVYQIAIIRNSTEELQKELINNIKIVETENATFRQVVDQFKPIYQGRLDSINNIYNIQSDVKNKLSISNERVNTNLDAVNPANILTSVSNMDSSLNSILTETNDFLESFRRSEFQNDKSVQDAYNSIVNKINRVTNYYSSSIARDLTVDSFNIRYGHGHDVKYFKGPRFPSSVFMGDSSRYVRSKFRKFSGKIGTDLNSIESSLIALDSSITRDRKALELIKNGQYEHADYKRKNLLPSISGISLQAARTKENILKLKTALANISDENQQIKKSLLVANKDSLLKSIGGLIEPEHYIYKFNNLITEKESQLSSLNKSFSDLKTALNDSDKKANKFNSVPELFAKYGMIIFLIFIIQILLSYNKYHYRLAGFYDSKADVLALRENIDDIDSEELIRLFDSSAVSFGKTEFIHKKAMDLLRDFIKSRPS